MLFYVRGHERLCKLISDSGCHDPAFFALTCLVVFLDST